MRWAMCAGCLLLGCGARVSEHAAGATGDGTGGASMKIPGAGGAPVAGEGGSAGFTLGAGSPRYASAPDAGTSCTYGYRECNTFDSYVDLLEDGIPFRLRYPGDPGCGRCSVAGCDLYSYAREACVVSIRVWACAGPDGSPPCLDTTSESDPYYIDRGGKRWGNASLSAWSLPAGVDSSTSMLDIEDAYVSFADGAQAPTLTAHVHLCAGISRLLLPC